MATNATVAAIKRDRDRVVKKAREMQAKSKAKLVSAGGKRVSINLPGDVVTALDELVGEGSFTTRTAALVEILRDYITWSKG